MMIGRELSGGQFQIVAELGEGGFAKVFRGTQRNPRREVAIKVLHENLVNQADLVTRFHHEAQTLARFDHPHIMKIYFEGEDQGLHYLVANLLRGDLKGRLKSGPPPLRETLRILRQITDALDYMHRKGFVHRDLKPANILFDENENAVLTDFGLARGRDLSLVTQQGMFLGTAAYMAPEQIQRGPGAAGPRSDLYALGCVIFEMIAGHPPFPADDFFAVCHSHLYEPAPELPAGELPAHLPPLVAAMLAKSPEDRPASAEEVLDEIAAAELELAGRPGGLRGVRGRAPAAPATAGPTPAEAGPAEAAPAEAATAEAARVEAAPPSPRPEPAVPEAGPPPGESALWSMARPAPVLEPPPRPAPAPPRAAPPPAPPAPPPAAPAHEPAATPATGAPAPPMAPPAASTVSAPALPQAPPETRERGQRRGPPARVLALAAAAVVLVAVGALWAMRRQPAPAGPAVTVVLVEPDRALASLDGHPMGGYQPYVIEDPRATDHTLELSYSGYRSQRRAVRTRAGRTDTLRVALVREAAPAAPAPTTTAAASTAVGAAPGGGPVAGLPSTPHPGGPRAGELPARPPAPRPPQVHPREPAAGARIDTINVVAERADGNPTVASVTLDGDITGKQTSCALYAPAAGVHRVGVTKTGYTLVRAFLDDQPVEVSDGQVVVRMPPGRRAQLRVVFEKD